MLSHMVFSPYSSAVLAAVAPFLEVEGGRFLMTRRTIGSDRLSGGSRSCFLQNEPK